MRELEFPFDSEYIIANKKKIKKELLNKEFKVTKNIAILGGSTTSNVKQMMELFLLNYGIKCNFYESEYNKYYEDAVFSNDELKEFNPDIIYIHVTSHNLINFPDMSDDFDTFNSKLLNEFKKYYQIWESLYKKFPNVVIIQNNFEMLSYRILGNLDAVDMHGRQYYINRINLAFYKYANSHSNFYINDINYLAAEYGLDKWHNMQVYYLYKYAMDICAIPRLAHNVSSIIKSICGLNKKAFALDMDNTLWGGVIGDDGVDNIVLGRETGMGEAYVEFQNYLKLNQSRGIPLTIISKNEEENGISGLKHPSSVLGVDDFICKKINWTEKSSNLVDIANEMGLTPDSYVFVDDNPMERDQVGTINGVAIPTIKSVEDYIRVIDHNNYFELLALSNEDIKRNDMYKNNVIRNQEISKYDNYDDYLKSLNMKARIVPFESVSYNRISQLSNKSNQFNLTTKRYSVNEIENISNDNSYIKIYGNLEDKFGDNGIVSVVIGKINNSVLDIELWIMSCRVLKRNMEFAMMDELVRLAKLNNITKINGYYYPTEKNKMVKDFYKQFDFTLVNEDNGNTTWSIDVDKYINKNYVIEVDNG